MNWNSKDEIIIAGHRGDKEFCPENTMPAFRRAISIGCDAIETDIHQTADGHMIIMHDHDVDRTTDGTGRICEKTLAEMKLLDAGIKFSEEFKGTPVPTLDEFLDLCEPHKDLLLNLELKDYPQVEGDKISFSSVDKVIAAVEKRNMQDRVMINSFSGQVLEYCHKKYPEYPLHGFYPLHRMSGLTQNPYEYLRYVCLFSGNLVNGKLTRSDDPVSPKEDFEYLDKQGNFTCVCFPKDTEELMQRGIDNGVVMFTSNNPETAIAIKKKLSIK
ncbi:MAG: hypothetical protein E7601_09680 [Ruminococcaceae bacterium]|nr:hypothetical protein [Oscillospiraceae bacterium]